MNAPKFTHSEHLFHQCGVMSIQNQAKFYIVISIYKLLNRLTPDYMKNMFERVVDVSVRSGHYYTIQSNTCSFKHNAFKHYMWAPNGFNILSHFTYHSL